MMMMGGGDKKKAIATILGPDPREHQEKQGEDSSPEALRACVSELIDSIHSHDVAGALACLRSIFAELEMEPHDEISHEE